MLQPKKPLAAVILFAGGKGWIKLKKSGVIKRGGNFLVRSRELFADNNLLVAVMEAPSNKQDDNGMYGGFRASKKHAQDVLSVVNYIKQQADIPVWLIGTSRGSTSAANGGIRLADHIDGIVLSASITESNNNGPDVPSMKLKKIVDPVFIVSHKKDPCWVTPASGSKDIKRKLKNSINVKVKLFEGGREKVDTRECGGKSHHGFYGIEKKVIDSMSEFILTQNQ